MRSKIIAIVNIVAFIATIAVNFLANSLPLGGKNTGELSDMYPNLFVPAGITFSIWGLIYLLLGAFVIYYAINVFNIKQKDVNKKEIGWLFALTCLENIGWIFAWHYQKIFLSLVIMIAFLFTLIKIYLVLNIKQGSAKSWQEKYFFHLPFSIYLGWITVATIANATAFLVKVNWNGFGFSDQFWTIAVIVVAFLITLINLYFRRDISYSLVIVWAFLGIIIKRLSAFPQEWGIIYTAAACGILILIYATIKILFPQKQKSSI